MTHTFTTHFDIRQYEMNSHGELPNSTLLRLLQETAVRASQDAGYDAAWYMKQGTAWVVHQMTFEHLCAVRYPTQLSIATWLSEMQRVHAYREYLVHETATGAVVARERAHWIYLNRETLFPARIAPEIIKNFTANGVRAISRIKPRTYTPPHLPAIEFTVARRVQHYEADEMQHVNNAIYVDWLEEALGDTVAAYPHSLPPNARLCVRRHDIEYARAALPGDVVEISVRLVGAGHCASAWQLEIKRGNESLVRDHVIALWVDEAGRLVRWQRK